MIDETTAAAPGDGEAAPTPDRTDGPTPEPALIERPQHIRRRRNRRRIKWALIVVLVLVLLSAGLWGVQRADRTMPPAALSTRAISSLPVPGVAPALPWPATGQAAMDIPSLGYAQQSGPETPVPIASLTKMTTALLILRDHPIPPGASGPTITVTPR